MRFYIYDLETMFNCFLFTGKFEDSEQYDIFEISDRLNERERLIQWLGFLQNSNCHMVGFNSLNFDYPIIHELLNNPYTFTAQKAYLKAQEIIGSQTYGQSPNHIRVQDRIIPQVDLVKVNHFDNPNKRTSLKSLQFAMRSESVEDLPFAFNVPLSYEQMNLMISYNRHDVDETGKFLKICKPAILMRKELLDHGVLTGDVLNYSDVKIGTEYLIKKIGRPRCFISGSNPRQSLRSSVTFKEIILPKINFRTETFNTVLQWFREQILYFGKDAPRPKLESTLGGLQFHFGVGGVHASCENRSFHSTDTHAIIDIDVSGMYVAVAIANGFTPEHLGQAFSHAYKQLQSDRAQYPKGSMMNAVLKLAGNGVYGNSNNTFSCFYDPKYTFSVTVNGQLQLLQLVESLSQIPGLELIQANTDGVTAFVPRTQKPFFDLWKDVWQIETGLKLEEVEYSHMWIRDVNNYLAITKDGKVKRKGAYWYPETLKDYDGWWNKDFSNMAAQKVVEVCLLHGWKPSEVIKLISDPFDFMLRYKTTDSAKLYIGGVEQLKTVRYYVSISGEKMYKVATPKGEIGAFKRANKVSGELWNKVMQEIPPGKWDARVHTKNKSKYQAVTTSVESGWLVKCCNKASDFNWKDVDYSYYAKEIEKLLIGE